MTLVVEIRPLTRVPEPHSKNGVRLLSLTPLMQFLKQPSSIITLSLVSLVSVPGSVAQIDQKIYWPAGDRTWYRVAHGVSLWQTGLSIGSFLFFI